MANRQVHPTGICPPWRDARDPAPFTGLSPPVACGRAVDPGGSPIFEAIAQRPPPVAGGGTRSACVLTSSSGAGDRASFGTAGLAFASRGLDAGGGTRSPSVFRSSAGRGDVFCFTVPHT